MFGPMLQLTGMRALSVGELRALVVDHGYEAAPSGSMDTLPPFFSAESVEQTPDGRAALLVSSVGGILQRYGEAKPGAPAARSDYWERFRRSP